MLALADTPGDKEVLPVAALPDRVHMFMFTKEQILVLLLTFIQFLSDYRFKQFLKYKAEEYSCEVVEVSEAYTSRTCTRCGKQQNIGSKKIMKCSCGLVLDRDLNGARNIFLKNIHLASKDSSISDVYSGMNLT